MVVGVASFLVDVIPAGNLTKSRMDWYRHDQIPLFVKRYHRLPASLQECSMLLKDRGQIFQDEWSREIIYRVTGTDTVELLSDGRDGKPGGTGKDADICLRFRVEINR